VHRLRATGKSNYVLRGAARHHGLCGLPLASRSALAHVLARHSPGRWLEEAALGEGGGVLALLRAGVADGAWVHGDALQEGDGGAQRTCRREQKGNTTSGTARQSSAALQPPARPHRGAPAPVLQPHASRVAPARPTGSNLRTQPYADKLVGAIREPRRQPRSSPWCCSANTCAARDHGR